MVRGYWINMRMRYRGDRDTELINIMPMRSCFSILYIDLFLLVVY